MALCIIPLAVATCRFLSGINAKSPVIAFAAGAVVGGIIGSIISSFIYSGAPSLIVSVSGRKLETGEGILLAGAVVLFNTLVTAVICGFVSSMLNSIAVIDDDTDQQKEKGDSDFHNQKSSPDDGEGNDEKAEE
ncbi:MAG: hypothetical protein PHW04_15590 [Candidatus Wallbacteria bacterium]|nr:hypothetical protein [Candidatus Wallbacteria bacterium]